jgi:manganese/iron transport system substrate-binding protein
MLRASIALVLLVLAGVILVPARPAASQSTTLDLATSIRPIADLVQNVGGDRVSVVALVPPGGEPEDYDPTPADAAAISRARVFFANGLGLETYLGNLAQAVGNPQLEVVTLADGLPTIAGFGQGTDAGGNPHLWLDPQNASHYVDVVQQTLDRIDPQNAATYDANAVAYKAKLQQLDAAIQQQVGALPPERRVLVTTHDAYPYFAQRYGFTYLAVISANPDAEPSAQEYAALVKTVQAQQVKAVFGEAGFSERTIAQLASDTGATFVGNLYTDTLSADSPANTYLGAMQYNADTIVNALR